MSAVPPPDLPPLFQLGFHRKTMAELEEVCVTNFALSTSRAGIFSGLKEFVERLEKAAITGEIWVDGSFLTEKINPKDVDVILRIQGSLYNAGTPDQRAAIDWVIANQKLTLKCDSYVLMEYPEGDPLHEEGDWWHAWWLKQWGFSREDDPKGIVVLSLSAGSAP
jgi:hypothetical protein